MRRRHGASGAAARAARRAAMVLVLGAGAGAGALGAGCEAEVSGTGTAGATAAAIELVTAAAPGPAAGVEKFGAPLSTGPAVDLDDVLAAPEKFTSGAVKIAATVEKVCKEKGCWMTLVGASGKADPLVRVTFKDYGFFMPKDSAGAKVTVEGTVSVAEESAGMAKHYAADEGADPVAVKGPVKKIAIEAAGVEMVRVPAAG